MRYLILPGVVAAAVVLFLVFRPADEKAAGPSSAATSPTTTAKTKPGRKPREKPKPNRRERRARANQETTFNLLVRDGRPVGGIRRLAVDKGGRVRLIVRADGRDNVHLHGYDISREVRPQDPARLAFEAGIAGRFDIELEKRQVQIAVLEVRP